MASGFGQVSSGLHLLFLGISVVVLAAALIFAVMQALRGSVFARFFLWSWAVLLFLAIPLTWQGHPLSQGDAAMLLLGVVVVWYYTNQNNLDRLALAHNETRRVLLESNNRIEEERRNISRRVHDEINPVLLVCRNELKRIRRRLEDPGACASLARLEDLLSEAYQAARDLIRDTRIEVIDSIGFTAATEALVSQLSSCIEKPKLTLIHDMPTRPAISQEVALNAYKIIREAILNSVKHAQATEVRIQLAWNHPPGKCLVTITDDGIGGAAARRSTDIGFGLLDMRERARAIGATIEIRDCQPRQPRPGTCLGFSFDTENNGAPVNPPGV